MDVVHEPQCICSHFGEGKLDNSWGTPHALPQFKLYTLFNGRRLRFLHETVAATDRCSETAAWLWIEIVGIRTPLVARLRRFPPAVVLLFILATLAATSASDADEYKSMMTSRRKGQVYARTFPPEIIN